MTTDDLIQYYVNLLIVQYATQPNALATVAAFVGQEINNQIYALVGAGFNFAISPIGIQSDSAIGAQLDAIGTYVGAKRVYYGFTGVGFYEFADAGEPGTFANPGMMDAEDTAVTTWYYATAESAQVPIYSLVDAQLYLLIQFRALVQSAFLSLENIDAILFEFFANNVALIDNENMTLLYVNLSSDTDPLFSICAVSMSLPHPSGVLVQAITVPSFTDWFGFQDALVGYDSGFAGYSDGPTGTPGYFISAP